MISVKKSKLKKVLSIIIISVLVFCILSFAVTKLVYDGIFARYDDGKSVTSGEQHRYYSGENQLSGYYFSSEKKDTLIVFAPGFKASVASYLPQIEYLQELGYGVFAFDPTGSCTSEGESHVGFSKQIEDVDSTLKYIEKNKSFGYNDIILMGHSRGGYAVCCALGYGHDIAAVVSVSGINSAMEGIIGSSEKYVGPLAYGNYGFLWLYQTMLFGADTVNMSASDEITDSGVPTLIIHGDADESVPFDRHSIMSYKDKIGDSAEYIICTDDGQDGHTDLLYDGDGANEQLLDEISEFIEKSIS